ncbi:MAG TPA: hypothetical protein PLM25_08000 [Limnochordia bacterium]|nr:hypothetical protein [Limnochordia bacterium]
MKQKMDTRAAQLCFRLGIRRDAVLIRNDDYQFVMRLCLSAAEHRQTS